MSNENEVNKQGVRILSTPAEAAAFRRRLKEKESREMKEQYRKKEAKRAKVAQKVLNNDSPFRLALAELQK